MPSAPSSPRMSRQPSSVLKNWSETEEERLAKVVNKYPEPKKWRDISGEMQKYSDNVRDYDPDMCRSKWKRMVSNGHRFVAAKAQGTISDDDDDDDDNGMEEEQQQVATSGRGLSYFSGGELARHNRPIARPQFGMTHDEAAARPHAHQNIRVSAGYNYEAASGEDINEFDYAMSFWHSRKPEERAAWKRKIGKALSYQNKRLKSSKRPRDATSNRPGDEYRRWKHHMNSRGVVVVYPEEQAPFDDDPIWMFMRTPPALSVDNGAGAEQKIYEDLEVGFAEGAQVEEQPLFQPLSADQATAEQAEEAEFFGGAFADGNGVDEQWENAWF